MKNGVPSAFLLTTKFVSHSRWDLDGLPVLCECRILTDRRALVLLYSLLIAEFTLARGLESRIVSG